MGLQHSVERVWLERRLVFGQLLDAEIEVILSRFRKLISESLLKYFHTQVPHRNET